MICKSFENLTIKEKIEMIGKVQHLIQTHEQYFLQAQLMIEKAEFEGLFHKVKILDYDKDTLKAS
jgi:hypothetical protein